MEFRNARFNQHGTIDCEINDPQFGWIPFTASPDDIYSVGHEVFEAAKDVAEPYVPPTPEEILAAERAAMTCTPAQMRLALDDMEAPDDATKTMLDVVEGIVAQDRKASIVWEYATQIIRTSPLIEALGTDFTPEQIDDIFRAAMAVET